MSTNQTPDTGPFINVQYSINRVVKSLVPDHWSYGKAAGRGTKVPTGGTGVPSHPSSSDIRTDHHRTGVHIKNIGH